jgi:hypothetical protein
MTVTDHDLKFDSSDDIQESKVWIMIFCTHCHYIRIRLIDSLDLLTSPDPGKIIEKVKIKLAEEALESPSCKLSRIEYKKRAKYFS